MGLKKIDEVLERERGKVAAIERVGVQVEDSFAGSGGGGGEDGFREAGADDD